MKKRWKVFWIVCAVLAAAGLLLTAAGAALGGLSALRNAGKQAHVTWSDFERTDPEDYIPGGPEGDGIMIFKSVEDVDLNLGGLRVCALAGDVSGVMVDTSYLRSDIREAVEDSIVCEDGGRELKIDVGKRLHGWNTNDTGTLYILYTSQKPFDSFSAELSAGSLELYSLWAEELSLSVGVGQILAEYFDAEHLETECGAGRIELQNGCIRKEAEIDCKLGRILVTLAFPAVQSDYNYELSWGAGEIMVGNGSYSGLFREAEIDNGSSRQIRADCGLGSIEIRFE